MLTNISRYVAGDVCLGSHSALSNIRRILWLQCALQHSAVYECWSSYPGVFWHWHLVDLLTLTWPHHLSRAQYFSCLQPLNIISQSSGQWLAPVTSNYPAQGEIEGGRKCYPHWKHKEPVFSYLPRQSWCPFHLWLLLFELYMLSILLWST